MISVEKLQELEVDAYPTEVQSPAVTQYLGRTASEEAQKARQALQESVDLRGQGYADD